MVHENAKPTPHAHGPLDHTQKASAELLHLPTELLIQVTQDLNDLDLRSLSFLCHRLHHIALSTLLARMGIPDATNLSSGELVLSGYTFTALPFLQRSIFITSIKRLSCRFNKPLFNVGCSIRRSLAPVTDPQLEADINGVRSLVSRCSSIDEATFDLANIRCWYGKNENALQIRRVLEAVSRICMNLMVKSDLRFTERFCDGPSICQSDYTIQIPNDSYMSFADRLLRAVQQYVAGMLHTSSPKRYAVENLTISTAMAVEHPILRQWTVDTLNGSPIVSLTINATNTLQPVLDSIFPDVHISTLQHFSIDCRVSFPILAAFLNRHRSITTLTIGTEVHRPIVSRYLVRCSLPALQTLTATPEYIVFLLRSSHALPSLMSICILSYIPIGPSFDITGISRTIAPVAHCLQAVIISIRLLIVSDNTEPAYAEMATIDGSPDSCLRRVTNLELELVAALPFVFGGDALHFISSWLVGFPPMVEHVSFCGVWFASTEWSARVSLIKLISEARPSVKTVTLDGERRTVAGWFDR